MKTETLNRQFLSPFIISLFILSVLLYLGYYLPNPDLPEPTWIRKAAYVLTLLNIPLIINLAFKALPFFKKPNLTLIAASCFSLLILLHLGIWGLVIPLLVLGGVFLVKQYYDLSKIYPFLDLRSPIIPAIVTVTPHLLFTFLVGVGAGKGLPYELYRTTFGEIINLIYVIYILLIILGVTIVPALLLATVPQRETLYRGLTAGLIALLLGFWFTPLFVVHGFRVYHGLVSFFNLSLLVIGVMLWHPFLESLVEGRFRLIKGPWRVVGCQAIIAMAMAAIFIATPVRWSVGVSSLVIDPSNLQVVYGITNKGMYKTTDGGKNWKLTGFEYPEISLLVGPLIIDPVNPQILYAVTWRDLYKTQDGGGKWIKVKELEEVNYYHGPIAVDPHNNQIIYISTEDGLFKSTDGGSSWKEVFVDYASSIAIDPINPEIVYVGTSGGVFKTTNRGESWVKLSKGFLEKYTASSLAIDPKDTRIIYAGVGREILKSTDAGESWMEVVGSEIDPFTFTPNLPIVINPTNTQVIYVGTNEGIFKTIDGGESWKAVKKGWKGRHISITFLAIDPRDSQVLWAGAIISPRGSEVLWAGTTTGVFKSTDGGESWELIRIRD